jgi:hypothetical protein
MDLTTVGLVGFNTERGCASTPPLAQNSILSLTSSKYLLDYLRSPKLGSN